MNDEINGTDTAASLLLDLGPTGWCILLALLAYLLRKPLLKALRQALWWALCCLWTLAVLAVHNMLNRSLSKEERRIVKRLRTAHWHEHAPVRGLEGTTPGKIRITRAGIVCSIRLEGKWTLDDLQRNSERIRALLGLRSGLRMEISPGKRGGWAQLSLRTRNAADSTDLAWNPKRKGIGIDTYTGNEVSLPLRTRFLVAGSSGAGKSVTLRPFLAGRCADPRSAVVMIDLKRVEGALWKTRMRIARTPEEVTGVVHELAAEMNERLEILEERGKAEWRATTDRPELYVVVDEGAEVMSIAKASLGDFESIARMGRAAGVHLIWCTQKPTMSGAGAGIPSQIAAQMDVRLALKLSTATECRTVFGEDATGEGWDAHTLAKPGWFMLRGTGRGPAPCRTWFMSDEKVKALPAAPIWKGKSAVQKIESPESPSKEIVPDGQPITPGDPQEAVLRAIASADSPVTAADLIPETKLSKATVYRVLKSLLGAGKVVKHQGGGYVVVAT